MTSDAIVVICACPDDEAAVRIASDLVSEGLAACVSRTGPVRSTYRWEGQLRDEPEVLLIIKSIQERFADLEVRLKSLHPYDVPEIIVLPVTGGSVEYLSWLRAAVS
jgi:periplasmic divalent cation tolerance protein